MRILITGANGYIGKTLHNALRDIHYVVAINRGNLDLTDWNHYMIFKHRP